VSFYGEGLQLSREQRSRILAGHYDPLKFDQKPECQEGDRYVLTWSKARQLDDGQGNKKVVGREPTHWITVRKINRKRRGGFTVEFDVVDKRDPSRFVRRNPPQMTDQLLREDNRRPPTEDATTQASEQSQYSSDRRSAVDELEAVPRKWIPPDFAQLHRKQEAFAKKDAMTPEQRLHAELEELRRHHPEDAERYERRVEVLADKMETVRRRKAA
jgi:hypothetical protein